MPVPGKKGFVKAFVIMSALHAKLAADCRPGRLKPPLPLGALSAIAALMLLAIRAEAFSLLGPFHDWMTNDLRFSAATGGPMDLGAGYRWNVPVVTYAFDPAFLDYFGSNGIAAVESALGILNSLPPASQLNANNYPPGVTHTNVVAQAAAALDLKSATLTPLVQQLGLGPPTPATYCLDSIVLSNCAVQQATVVGRNFDPFSLAPSTNVDDTPVNYFYVIICTWPGPGRAMLVESPGDRSKPWRPAVADGALGSGEFYTGLTRDDAGGIRYLLQTNTLDFEPLLPGVYGIGTNSAAYVDRAVRPGIENLTFVRRDYDALLGVFFVPFTNQFTILTLLTGW
jgi:hypothetical protein